MSKEYKPLKLKIASCAVDYATEDAYLIVLSNLAIAESNLVRAGKDSALPHFIAIEKFLEERMGFEFIPLHEERSDYGERMAE